MYEGRAEEALSIREETLKLKTHKESVTLAVPPSSGQAVRCLWLCLEAGRGWHQEQGLDRSWLRFA